MRCSAGKAAVTPVTMTSTFTSSASNSRKIAPYFPSHGAPLKDNPFLDVTQIAHALLERSIRTGRGFARHCGEIANAPELAGLLGPHKKQQVAAEPTSGVMNRVGRGRDLILAPHTIRTCKLCRIRFPPSMGMRQLYAAVCKPAHLSRHAYAALRSGACVAGPHSPSSPPFAPPAPQRIAPALSHELHSYYGGARLLVPTCIIGYGSSPFRDADRPSHSTLTASHEISQLPTRSFCA